MYQLGLVILKASRTPYQRSAVDGLVDSEVFARGELISGAFAPFPFCELTSSPYNKVEINTDMVICFSVYIISVRAVHSEHIT